MDTSREMLKRDLTIIYQLDKKIDYSNKEETRKLSYDLFDKNTMNTAIGYKYIHILKDASSGKKDSNCIVCKEGKCAYNSVFCDKCYKKIGGGQQKSNEGNERKSYNDESNLKVATSESEKSVKKILVATIVAVILLLTLYFGVGSYILSSRTTYKSETEMQDDIIGVYTYYNGEEPFIRLNVKKNTVVWRYVRLSTDKDIDRRIKSWKYKRGKIITSIEDIVVNKNGDLICENKVFEPSTYYDWLDDGVSSDYWNDSDDDYDTNNNQYETAYSAVRVQDVKVTSNSSYTICTGSVKNYGTKTYRFIEVKGAFKDYDGNTIDTTSTYAVGSEGIEPGESSTFSMSVSYNGDIKDCSVSVYDYD